MSILDEAVALAGVDPEPCTRSCRPASRTGRCSSRAMRTPGARRATPTSAAGEHTG